MSAEMVAALLADICPDCGRTKSQAERAYPVGWEPEPGVEIPESAVPPCCPKYITDTGSPEDFARREADCWAHAAGRKAAPVPSAVVGVCRVCGLRESGEPDGCPRSITVGSEADRLARRTACAKRGALGA